MPSYGYPAVSILARLAARSGFFASNQRMHRTTRQPQATFWGRSSAGLCSRNETLSGVACSDAATQMGPRLELGSSRDFRCKKLGLEGIVSKRKNSPYRSGRSPDWLKMKNPKAAAVKREAEEDLDELFVYNRHRHLDI
jgi:hypothetical protein